MGAWIEIFWLPFYLEAHPVALFMGAWIEMFSVSLAIRLKSSHSSWVRGLKSIFFMISLESLKGRTLHGCVD